MPACGLCVYVSSCVFTLGVRMQQWTFNTMVGAIRDPFFSPNAWVHSGLNFLFHQTIRKPMTRFVHEVKLILRRRSRSKSTKKKPFVVVFTGHSQGGASASYAAWFVSKHLSAFVKKGLVAVYCITFASPMVSGVPVACLSRRIAVDATGKMCLSATRCSSTCTTWLTAHYLLPTPICIAPPPPHTRDTGRFSRATYSMQLSFSFRRKFVRSPVR